MATLKSEVGSDPAREFSCLDAMRTARSIFLDAVVAHAQRHKAELAALDKPSKEIQVDILRSENTFQIAEFYYLVEHFELNEPQRISSFIIRHNADMREFLTEKEKMRQQGLLPQRINDAIFSEEQIAKVVITPRVAACDSISQTWDDFFPR